MEITKVVKPFIRRGRPNTFGNIVYVLTNFAFVVVLPHIFGFLTACWSVMHSVDFQTVAGR